MKRPVEPDPVRPERKTSMSNAELIRMRVKSAHAGKTAAGVGSGAEREPSTRKDRGRS